MIDKEEGRTSFDIVKGIKRITGIKKVGHAGTLDPFATGLLVVLLGQGTRLSSCLMAGRKRYLATIRLGMETDTLDPTGKVVRETGIPELDRKTLSGSLDEFRGEIRQRPPAYSAINVKGQRAYSLARKGVEVKLEERQVTIYSLEPVELNLPEIKISVTCSPGTYIRSLASDIGNRLGTVAHLSELRRTSSGVFGVDDALNWKDIGSFTGEDLKRRIIPMKDALPEMHEIPVDDSMGRKIRNGYRPSPEDLQKLSVFPDDFSGAVKVVNNSSLVAVIEVERLQDFNSGCLKKMRVFN